MKPMRNKTLMMITAVLLAVSVLFLGGCSRSGESSGMPESSGQTPASVPESSQEESSQEENSQEESPQEPSGLTPEQTAEISERAMDNFAAKIQGSGYTVSADGYLTAHVYSQDLVWFDYDDDDNYRDFAVMSVGGEVFQGFPDENGISGVSFLSEGSALETAGKRLPGYFLSMSEGNIYNLFYNDPEDPLKFVSYDTNVQNFVRTLVGYGEITLRYMHEVCLILDAEDPTCARLQCVVEDDEVARYYFDDIDIVITFGNAQPEPHAQAWMAEPEYPQARLEWSDADLFIFDSVFLPGYGREAVPYPSAVSYALTVDAERFVTDDAVYIRDPHATQEDMASYEAILSRNGFEKADGDGTAEYRRLLRDETKCYSSISLEYDRGMNVTARKYYEYPKYEGLEAINAAITQRGYPALPETQAVTDLTAVDTGMEQTESWLYFYDYDMTMYVYGKYGDSEQLSEYLDSVAQGYLDAGYEPVWAVDEADGEVDHYRCADGSMTFRYHMEDDGETVILLYKAEKLLTPDQIRKTMADEGFPEMDLSAYAAGRDHRKFQEVMYGRQYRSAISFSLRYESVEKASAFMDGYVALLDDKGFLNGPGNLVGSNKPTSFRLEEEGIGLAFEFMPSDSGETNIYFEFRSGIDFSEETPEEGDTGPKPILGSKNSAELSRMR